MSTTSRQNDPHSAYLRAQAHRAGVFRQAPVSVGVKAIREFQRVIHSRGYDAEPRLIDVGPMVMMAFGQRRRGAA